MCLTQLYGGIDMYNLLHKEKLHILAPLIGHLQVDKLVSSYTRLVWVVYSGEFKGDLLDRGALCLSDNICCYSINASCAALPALLNIK